MADSKKMLSLVGIPIVAVLVGMFLIIYAFELVSIPHAHEYHESFWGIFGFLFILGGLGWVAYNILSKPR